MKIIQIIIFSISVVLFLFCFDVIWEFHESINDPGFNPNDGQAGFVFIGIIIAMIFNFVASVILLAINIFIGTKREKIYLILYYYTNVLLVVDGLFLIIAKRFL